MNQHETPAIEPPFAVEPIGVPITDPGEPTFDQPWPIVAASMVLGTVALLILGLQPVLLGALTQDGRLTEAGLGRAATAEVLALAVGSAVGPWFMRAGAMRLKSGLACLALAGANFATYAAHTGVQIYVLRGAAGLLEGVILGATILVLTHTRHPDRLNGLFLAVQTIPQMAAAYVLPVAVIPRFGANAGFGFLGACAIISALGAFGLREGVGAAQVRRAAAGVWTAPVLIAMAAIVLQNAAIGGAWSYAERIAQQRGFGADAVGLAISAGLGAQVIGAFLVAWVGWRLPYRLTLTLGAVAQAAVIIILGRAGTPGGYIAASCVFGLFWLALAPFQVRLIIDLDRTRQAALALAAIGLVGFSLGPLVGSFAVRDNDVTGAFWASAGMMLMSALLYGLAVFGRRPAELSA